MSGRTEIAGDVESGAMPSPAQRLGLETAARRRRLEGRPQHLGDGRKWLPLQVLDPIMRATRRALDLLGLYSRLARRATRLSLVEREVYSPRVPPTADGLRILHLSDLHIDGAPGFGRRLADLCAGLEFDLAVVTGDLRLDIAGPCDRALEEMRPLVAVLDRGLGAWAILGNHDPLDIVEPLEAMGLRYLLNESVRLTHGDTVCHLAGVDDAHFFGTDDLDRALREVPVDELTVLLAHSPDLIEEAAERYVDLYLCGHTHGGQICLPWGGPLVSNASCPRRFVRGGWRLGALAGYTSRGVGFSGVPLRAFCPPEIVIHTLLPERRNRCRRSWEDWRSGSP